MGPPCKALPLEPGQPSRSPNVWAGYAVGVLIVALIVWGLVGARHARFSDFVYNPSTTVGYLRDLRLVQAKRYIGHNPGGGAMVVLLLLFLTATVVTGIVVYGGEHQAEALAACSVRKPARP